MIKKVHEFRESLKRSHSYEDAPWWLEVYQKAFVGLIGVHSIRQDGWAQRAGIDRLIVLKSGKHFYVDEKVREKNYQDILIERWSDEARRIPGWIQKDLACDYIAYAIAPTQICYLLPFQQLRKAWISEGKQWMKKYRPVRANNPNYVTLSYPIPTQTLMNAMQKVQTIHWETKWEIEG